MKTIMSLTFGLIFLLGGLKLSLYSHQISRNARASENWTSTEAHVTEFQIIQLKGSGGNASERVDIEISYDYQVDKNPYSSTRISMAASDSLKELPTRPQAGDKITIYYDPANPKNATWIKGAPKRAFGLILVGYLFTGIGLVLIFKSVRAKLLMVH